MWRRIREIVLKEFRQALREPRMRLILFVPPLVQLIVFGFAVNLDVDHVSIAWLDQDRTIASRNLLADWTLGHFHERQHVHQCRDRLCGRQVSNRRDDPDSYFGILVV